MATARDVAELAGTSTAVVSYVFNNGPRPVAAATRQRVLKAAAELQYRPNALAKALSAGRTHSIGLVVPHIRNSYFAALAEQLERVTRERDHLLLIGDAGGDKDREDRLIESFVERQVDGLVLVSLHDMEDLSGIDTGGVAAVALHPVPDGARMSSLAVVSVDAARDATAHLLAHGHTRIGLLTEPAGTAGSEEHLAGALAAAAGKSDVRIDHQTCTVSRYDARDLGLDWFRRPDRPHAVYCATDEQAFGILNAAWEVGLEIPGDLAVIGGDGTDECAVTVPPLAAIHRPVDQLAELAIETLLDHEPGPPTQRALGHTLIRRTSCGCQQPHTHN